MPYKNKIKSLNTLEGIRDTKLFEVSEMKLSYKPAFTLDARTKIESSRDSFELFQKAWNMDEIGLRESFYAIMINRANRPIGIFHVGDGGMAGCVADPKMIFTVALLCGAHGLIVAHNHPSGSIIASSADIDITRRIKTVGEAMEIRLLDHIIITGDGSNKYFSFADEGML